MRLAPGEKTLTNAAKITFPEVGEGDRVWARGKVADDHKSVPAAALIVMDQADIAKKQEAERADWMRKMLELSPLLSLTLNLRSRARLLPGSNPSLSPCQTRLR